MSDDDDFTLFSQLPSRVTCISDDSSSSEDPAGSGNEAACPISPCDTLKCEPKGPDLVLPDGLSGQPGHMRARKALLDSSDDGDDGGEIETTGPGLRRRVKVLDSSSEEDDGERRRACQKEKREDDGVVDTMQRLLLSDEEGLSGALGGAHIDEQRPSKVRQSVATHAHTANAQAVDEKEEDERAMMAAAGKHKTPKKFRVAYNQLVREAQTHEKEGHLGRAVTRYKEAMAISDEDGKLAKKISKMETLRAVRRQSTRQSMLVSKVEDDGVVFDAQDGWYFDSSRALYALSDNPEYGLAPSLYTRLLPYQRDGVRWLWQLRCAGPGGILGDEMHSLQM